MRCEVAVRSISQPSLCASQVRLRRRPSRRSLSAGTHAALSRYGSAPLHIHTRGRSTPAAVATYQRPASGVLIMTCACSTGRFAAGTAQQRPYLLCSATQNAQEGGSQEHHRYALRRTCSFCGRSHQMSLHVQVTEASNLALSLANFVLG